MHATMAHPSICTRGLTRSRSSADCLLGDSARLPTSRLAASGMLVAPEPAADTEPAVPSVDRCTCRGGRLSSSSTRASNDNAAAPGMRCVARANEVGGTPACRSMRGGPKPAAARSSRSRAPSRAASSGRAKARLAGDASAAASAVRARSDHSRSSRLIIHWLPETPQACSSHAGRDGGVSIVSLSLMPASSSTGRCSASRWRFTRLADRDLLSGRPIRCLSSFRRPSCRAVRWLSSSLLQSDELRDRVAVSSLSLSSKLDPVELVARSLRRAAFAPRLWLLEGDTSPRRPRRIEWGAHLPERWRLRSRLLFPSRPSLSSSSSSFTAEPRHLQQKQQHRRRPAQVR